MTTVAKRESKHKKGLKKAYLLLNAKNPEDLMEKYADEDQKYMYAKEWDYNNKTQVMHKIKDILERIDRRKLSKDEKYWTANILWFWYHHAITCAIWRYKDKKNALKYSRRALLVQPRNHPNKITKLFYLLIRDKLVEAKKWQKTITLEPEKTTAKHFLEIYTKKGLFN